MQLYIDSRAFRALPESGGILDQDYDMLADWRIIADEEAKWRRREERRKK